MAQTQTPSYKDNAFIDALANALKPETPLLKQVNTIASNGDKHLGEYARDMIEIRKILVAPDPNFGATSGVSEQQQKSIEDIVLKSKHSKRVRFLVNKLWGINLTAASKAKKPSKETLSTLSPQTEFKLKNSRSITSSDGLRHYLTMLGEQSAPPESIDLDALTKHLAESISDVDQHVREYLTSMLSIGAALVLFRVQRKLSAPEEIQEAEDRLYAALNRFLKKRSESALKTDLGRISRAYRSGMAFYLKMEEPAIGQYVELWDFYKKSVEAIPMLVDAFFSGELPRKHLNGIPHLPRLGYSEPEQSTSPKEGNDVTKTPSGNKGVQLLLKSDSVKFQENFLKKPEEEQLAVIESTVLVLQKVNNFFESLDGNQLHQQKDSIYKEINRLQAIAKRLED